MFKYAQSQQSKITPVDVRDYHLRLYRTISLEEMSQFIDGISKITKYIISKEYSKTRGEHFHCYLVFEDAKDLLKNREQGIRDIFIKRFNIQDANSDYSFSPRRNENQLKKYVLKDGQYRYKNIPKDEIEALVKASNKKGKDQFGEDLTRLEDNYLKSKDMTIKSFYHSFVKLKVSYGQNIYPSHCDAYVYKIQFKKDPRKIIDFVESRLAMMRLDSMYDE